MINLALKSAVIKKPILSLAGWYFRVNPRMITCREFNDCIFDHIEQNLPAKQSLLFKRHMQTCPLCHNFFKTYIATYKTKDHTNLYEDIYEPNSPVIDFEFVNNLS